MEAPLLWKNYGYLFPRVSPYYGFCCLFSCYGTGKPLHFPCDNYTTKLETNEKEVPYVWKTMGNNIPGSPPGIGFAVFTQAMENWWQDSRISCITKPANFFLWKLKINTMTSYYNDLHRDWAIIVFKWFVTNYLSSSPYGHFLTKWTPVFLHFSIVRATVKMKISKMKDFVITFI